MSEIAKFVNNGSASITPAMAEKILHHLPQWKLEFTQINAPKFPHLVNQLEFLAAAVEDAVEGAYKELPYIAVAQSVFALLYAHKKMGIIPESILELGRADDSSVVRAVLIQNEKVFAVYADSQGINWEKITSQP
jgi:uncharacterized membrane protein YkvA (DUF1232 family)